MPDNLYISKVRLPGSKEQYLIKDAEARQMIQDLGSPMHFVGKFDTLPPVADYESGDVCVVANKEYILVDLDGTKSWEEFGDLGDLGQLAYADTASAEYQPAGSVTTEFTPAGQVTVEVAQVSGTISQPTFTGTAFTATSNFTPEGTISVGEGAANYTPEGTISAPEFTGTTATISVSGQYAGESISYQPDGTVSAPEVTTATFTGAESTFMGQYQPAGTISAPSTTAETVVKSVTATASGSSAQYDKMTASVGAVDETLTLAYATTTVSNIVEPTITVTPVTADVVASVAAPTFTGTTATISTAGVPDGSINVVVAAPTFTGTTATIEVAAATINATGSYTPEGSVSTPTFTGTGAQLVFTGSVGTVDITATPEGTISTPTFTGATPTATATFVGTTATVNGTFTGTVATITVNPD